MQGIGQLEAVPRTRMAGVAGHRRSPLVAAFTTVAAVLLAVVTWAWSDVLTWQRIFESRGLYEYDAQYQAGHEVVLFGLIGLGVILLMPAGRRWAIAYALAVYTLAYGGLADLLYYWLDGRAIPSTLPWLDPGHPLLIVHPVTGTGLILSTAAWGCTWLVALLLALAGPGILRRLTAPR